MAAADIPAIEDCKIKALINIRQNKNRCREISTAFKIMLILRSLYFRILLFENQSNMKPSITLHFHIALMCFNNFLNNDKT